MRQQSRRFCNSTLLIKMDYLESNIIVDLSKSYFVRDYPTDKEFKTVRVKLLKLIIRFEKKKCPV